MLSPFSMGSPRSAAIGLTLACGALACGADHHASDGDGGDDQGIDFKVTGVEVRDITIPGALHSQGLPVPARMYLPVLEGGPRPMPALVVMHGSGGLFAMLEDGETVAPGRPCSDRLEPQFARWGERLARLGYVALMPASHDARGFCDYYDDTARIPDDFDEPRERLLGRLYDLDAASRHLCGLPDVDCDRLGLLGFSHGASTLMLALHHQLRRALGELGDALTPEFPVQPLAPGGPAFQVGVAYYPGCGLETLVHLRLDADPLDMYFPRAPLYLEHGSQDDLIEDCSAEYGQGRRQLQSSAVAKLDHRPDPYHIRVHPDARHGFDNAGGAGTDEGSGGKRPEDLAARDAALAATLTHLADALGGARR